MTAFLADKIASFDSDDELKQLAIGAGREKFERPSVWVELYERALVEQGRIAKACHDAGIEDRVIAIAEEQGRQFDRALRAILDRLFAALVVAGAQADLLDDFRRDQLPAIVRSVLSSLIVQRPPELGGQSVAS